MHQLLSEEGVANIFANFLGAGLEPLLTPDPDPRVVAITDLPPMMMNATCNNLRIRADVEDVYVVAATPGAPWQITPEGLRERVGTAAIAATAVVFVPEADRPALDETFPEGFFTPFDTFRSLETVERQMIGRINRVPVYKRVATLWSQHAAARIPILKRLDYLINIIGLCLDADEMGTLFHKLDLIPDRHPNATGRFPDRLARNVMATTMLCNEALPPAVRVAALHLTDAALGQRIAALLADLDAPTPSTLTAAIFGACGAHPEAEMSFDRWRFEEETGWT